MSRKFYSPEITREEVKEATKGKAVLSISIATIEQHREHLPLHTDIDNVISIMKGIAGKLNQNMRVLVGSLVFSITSLLSL